MTAPRFIQVHTLTAYPASLLNRDDAGLAKRIPFGGVSRTRISSQCLKRHWRTAQDAHALRNVGLEMAVRSRVTLSRKLIQPLVAAGLPQDRLEAALEGMLKGGLFQEAEAKRSARAKAGDEDDAKEPFVTGQVTVLGDPELTYLRDVLRELAAAAGSEEEARKQGEARVKAERQNLRALRNGAGLDAAMFGRMVTSDILARKNAAVHVAHAFTVHAEESESDYFTAVDDLLTGVEETGSGHIGETELTSGLFYGYVVVDLPQLVYNLAGKEDGAAWEEAWRADAHRDDRALAAQVTGHLLHLIAKVSPGAKLGSTAPYSWAQLVLLEAGDRQPRTLANAFLTPVRANGGSGLAAAAAQALAAQLGALDSMYGAGERRWLASAIDGGELPEASRLPFDEAVRAVVDTIGE